MSKVPTCLSSTTPPELTFYPPSADEKVYPAPAPHPIGHFPYPPRPPPSPLPIAPIATSRRSHDRWKRPDRHLQYINFGINGKKKCPRIATIKYLHARVWRPNYMYVHMHKYPKARSSIVSLVLEIYHTHNYVLRAASSGVLSVICTALKYPMQPTIIASSR
jgi:hypothetical protein